MFGHCMGLSAVVGVPFSVSAVGLEVVIGWGGYVYSLVPRVPRALQLRREGWLGWLGWSRSAPALGVLYSIALRVF